MSNWNSWGNYPKAADSQGHPAAGGKALPAGVLLPRGLGRSYGDCCLNNGHVLLTTEALNGVGDIDSETGTLRVGAGVSFDQLLQRCVPQGWFPPVTPGTKYVTIGGAVANDVHGKNHHVDGTFGQHVVQLELLRSSGDRLLCSQTENRELFAATIGGFGLTGLIVWAEIRLKPIRSAFLDVQTIRFSGFDEFLALSEEHRASPYTVAWIDSLANGSKLGRGHFIVGDHADSGPLEPHGKQGWRNVPFFLPGWTLNRFSVRLFNTAYYHRAQGNGVSRKHYDSFFYPLDGIRNWNRIYGRRGFVQYQCVVPTEVAPTVLQRVVESGFGSFLTVMKLFGASTSPGIMSFPQPGLTLTFDFPVSRKLLAFLDEVDEVVMAHAGRVYVAKDARMSQRSFRVYYPEWERFKTYVDPNFSSDFWRRMTNG